MHACMQVDAALDATNVARVAHYIRSRTRMHGSSPRNPHSVYDMVEEEDEEAEDEEALGEDEDAGSGRQKLKRRGPGASFQSIVISLKDVFYEKADALVGVCRDLDARCSRTFTFDLERFDEPQPDTA